MRSLAFVLLAACVSPMLAQKVMPAPTAPTGTLTGHVTFADTQRSARFADIILIPKPDAAVQGALDKRSADVKILYNIQTATGADGNFTAENLPPGDYLVIPHVPGYILPIQLDSQHRQPDIQNARAKLEEVLAQFTPVQVAASRTTTAEFTLVRGAVFSGHVRFEDGSPVVGRQVRVKAAEGVDPFDQYLGMAFSQLYSMSLSATTDDAGQYRIAGIPPGKYTIEVSLPSEYQQRLSGTAQRSAYGAYNSQRLTVYAPAAFRKSEGTIMEIHGAEFRADTDISIDFSKLHSVSGHVRSAEDQHGIAGGFAELTDDADKTTYVRNARFAADGSFHIVGIPAGTFQLRLINVHDPRPGASENNVEVIRQYKDTRLPVIVADRDLLVPDVMVTPVAKEPQTR